MALRMIAFGLVSILVTAHAFAQPGITDDPKVMEYLSDQYERLRQFHEKSRTRTMSQQEIVTVQVPVEKMSTRTVQIPVVRRVCRYVKHGFRWVCICSNVTVMETRQTTMMTTVMETRQEQRTVQRAVRTGIPLTGTSTNTKRLVQIVDLNSLPAAAGPEGNRMLAESKLASGLQFETEQVVDNEVFLETGWFNDGGMQMQITVIASPIEGTAANDVAFQLTVQNAIQGSNPPNPGDLRPVSAATLARARKIAIDILRSYRIGKP